MSDMGGMTAQRICLAPIAITPTKPLTPSHVKALLWLDVLFKATACLHPTTLLCNRRTYDTALQTVGFWEFLDTECPDVDYAEQSEPWFGSRYLDFHQAVKAGRRLSSSARYRESVERDGWLHPSSLRILDIWRDYYARLGLEPSSLTASSCLRLPVEGLWARLAELDCLLDARADGAGVFLDLTAEGKALRQLVDADGTDNYLVGPLRELLDEAGKFDLTLLLCDEQLDADYLSLQRVLERSGHAAMRLCLGRVALPGGIRSSREGGWQEYTLDRLLERFEARYPPRSLRLGFRLYFLAALGRSAQVAFSWEDLEHSLQRADKTLNRLGGPREDPELCRTLLARVSNKAGHADPYRTASLLFANQPHPDAAALLPIFVS